MIASIKHKGLREFYESGIQKRVQANHVPRLRLMLAALDSSQTVDDMDIPGYRLHALKVKVKVKMKNRWSVSVNGNWRLTFEFREGNVYLLDYENYH